VILTGIGLGRVLGFPVRLDLSWFAGLAVLVALSRELWAPAATGLAAVALSGAFAVAFFACVLVHELAHALVARAIGVPTAEIRLFVFGGVARIRGEPADPGGEALVAMAGPLASVTLAGLLGLASWRVPGAAGDLAAWLFLGNLVVAGFNLLPGFPLDGGRVARALLWCLTGRRPLATRVTALAGRALAARTRRLTTSDQRRPLRRVATARARAEGWRRDQPPRRSSQRARPSRSRRRAARAACLHGTGSRAR
jgi:Zn-dependent protease